MTRYKLLNTPFSLPDSWSELTDRQLRKISPYLFHPFDDWAMRVKVLLLLAPVLSVKRLRQMGQSNAELLVRNLEWIWLSPMDSCPIDHFHHQGTIYYLPDPVFDNMVGIEYVSADHHFKQFARDKPTPGALDALLATICRPAKKGLDERDPEWDGDRREKYNSKIAERRAQELKSLPLPTKMIVLQYFIGQQRAFHARYQELFTSPTGGGGGRAASFGLLGVLDSLAVDGLFGTFDQVCFTNVHTIFFHMLKQKRDAPKEE